MYVSTITLSPVLSEILTAHSRSLWNSTHPSITTYSIHGSGDDWPNHKSVTSLKYRDKTLTPSANLKILPSLSISTLSSVTEWNLN